MKLPLVSPHPKGESHSAIRNPKTTLADMSKSEVHLLETFGGRVHVEWNPPSKVTSLGQLPFFIEYLKLGNLFEPWVEEFPLALRSPNAPSKRDILGTVLLSVLSGHWRYAHITALRCDTVNPALLGMRKVVSEDSLRHCLEKVEEESGIKWLQNHLEKCYSPLLSIPWILDVDTTIKVLYGKQEDAKIGYNPQKPGRPSHTYHSYILSHLRLILDVEVQAGNKIASSYSGPGLWLLLERIGKDNWPKFIRGDCGFGTDGVMTKAEEVGIAYLFKLKITKNVKKLIENLTKNYNWKLVGQGWEGQESNLQLMGWKNKRRVIILRRKKMEEIISLNQPKEMNNNYEEAEKNNPRQLELKVDFCEEKNKITVYEYSVLVTSLSDEISTIAQYYRDRADCENVFDELKNQWGWGGFTTQDIKRCRIMSRMIGLVYNWWSLFVRLAEPDKHLEAITNRPLLLHGIGQQTNHAGQTRISVSSTHGKTNKIRYYLNRITRFFNELKAIAEQLTSKEMWYRILSKAVEKYLNGSLIHPPDRLILAT